jgi:sulfite exporter TauE/SafE
MPSRTCERIEGPSNAGLSTLTVASSLRHAGSDDERGSQMTAKAERNVGLTLAAAGVGIIGIAVVFGLTTADGGPDWVGIITAAAGLIMVATGLFRAFRRGAPHAA